MVLRTLWVIAALGSTLQVAGCDCAASHQRPAIDQDAQLSDAMLSETDAAVDSSIDIDAAIPPDDCEQQFDALDNRCQSNSDCEVVVQLRCGEVDAEGRALAIARGAVDDFDALARLCRVPTSDSDGCGDTMWPPYLVAQESRDLSPGVMALQARCDAGRCISYWAFCGPELCGNGQRDECFIRDNGLGPRSSTTPIDSVSSAEPCDGVDVGTHTCQSEGFGGGTIGCVPNVCVLDRSQCSACRELGDGLTACNDDASNVAQDLSVSASAYAVSETDVGLAWTQWLDGQLLVHFARYNDQLVELSRAILAINAASTTLITGDEVQLAAHPQGWLVSLDVSEHSIGDSAVTQRVELYAIDAGGGYQGSIGAIEAAWQSRWVPRPSGMPLLLARVGEGEQQTMAVPIADDLSIGGQIMLNAEPVIDAIFIGDGFLVALGSDNPWFTLQRVELNGSVVRSGVVYEAARVDPRLLFDGQAAYLATNRGSLSPTLEGLAYDGALDPSGLMIELPAYRESSWRFGHYAALGDRFVVTPDLSSEARVLMVDRQGALIATHRVAQSPNEATVVALMPQGDHLIVGFYRSNGSAADVPSLGLARVDP